MTDCIFCKIVSGEIPSEKVYEDDTIFAFLDIAPLNPGHTLVVTKEHYENALDVSDELLSAAIRTAKKIGNALKNAVRADAVNIVINNGKEAGQIVPHFHIHVIPRFKEDGCVSWKRTESSTLPDTKMLGEKIRNSFV